MSNIFAGNCNLAAFLALGIRDWVEQARRIFLGGEHMGEKGSHFLLGIYKKMGKCAQKLKLLCNAIKYGS